MIINAKLHLGGVNAIVVVIQRINLVDWSSLWWHQFYGLWNASQCFHNAIQLGHSIHHWAGESLLIGWRADCHSPAEKGNGFWRSSYSYGSKKRWGLWRCRAQGARWRDTATYLYAPHRQSQPENRGFNICFYNERRSLISEWLLYGSLDSIKRNNKRIEIRRTSFSAV